MLAFPGLKTTTLKRRPYSRLARELASKDKPKPAEPPKPADPAPQPQPQPPAEQPKPPEPKKKEDPAIVKIDKAADDFCKSEVNILQVVAEGSVFSGILFLKWASGITKPKKFICFVKAILVLTFLILHPIYCVVSMGVLSLVYIHWCLHRKVS